MFWSLIFIALVLVGLVDAGYMFLRYRQKKPLTCLLHSKCNLVTESKWATVFWVRNEILGLVYYGVLLLGGLVALFQPTLSLPVYFFLLPVIGLGFIYSVFLTGLQTFVIKEYCLYCLTSAFVTTLLLIINLVLINKL